MFNALVNKVNFFIAKQHLLARKKQSFLAILGVLLGVTTFIVMASFMTGVNQFLDDAVFNGNPDITIYTNNKSSQSINTIPADTVAKIAKTLKKHETVKAFSQQFAAPAILISNAQQLPIRLNGIIPDQEDQMVDLDRRLLSGTGFQSLNYSTDDKSILLGVSLAKRLKVTVGDSLKIILPNGSNSYLDVKGIFSFGITTIDNIRTYVHAETLRKLLKQPEDITAIHIRLNQRNQLQLKDELIHSFDSIEVNDWKEQNKTIVIGNKVRNILTWSVSFAILLVAGFGMYNVLHSVVLNKRKDIAVLKSIGYHEEDIIAIFLIQAFVIGLIGAVLGLAMGYLISLSISTTPIGTSDFIIVDTYPVNFDIAFYIFGSLFGLLTTLLATYFPTKKASAIDPVKTLRGL